MSSMGELTFFLGLQVKQLPEGIFISQDKYVADILKKFIFYPFSESATSSIESNKPLVKDEDGVDVDVHVYDWLSNVFDCIKARHHVCCLCLDSPFELEAYSNSDYGGASIDRKSTTCGCQFLGKRLILAMQRNDKHGFEDGQKLGCKFFLFMVLHMANLKYSDKHNIVAFLKKPNESVGFTEVVDFLKDATGIHNLSDAEIYAGLATLGYVTRGYAGDFVPLLPAMLAGAAVDQGEGSTQPAEPHHTPVDPISSTSQPPIPSPPHPSPPLPSPPHPSPPLPSPPHPSPPPYSPHQSPPFSPPHYSPPRSYEAPLPEGNTSGSAEDSMQLKELMDLYKVGAPELKLWRQSCNRQRQLMERQFSPWLKGESMKMNEKLTDFVTPTKASGEAQEEDISPTILEADKTLLKVASQGVSKVKSTDKGKIYRRRASIEEVSTGSAKVDFEEVGLEEAIKLQAQMDEKVAKQINLDEMIAKRMAEEEALSEQQKKRKAQLKKLSFEEIKEEFDKLVQRIDTFVPMDFEATKAKLKRYGEELQTKTSKKQKIDDKDVPAIGEKVAEVKEEEPVKRTGKRKKQKARKGISVDKNAQGDSETDKDESVEAMNPTPLATKSNIVVNWKIFQQGQRSVYQIMRANGADTVYMSFGAMIKDFTREDLIELYRLVMQKYGTNRPEDAYDRVLWSDLRTMFDPPLNEDAIWSLPLQQKMVSWRYYDKCAVHCLTLEASTIYMLADRKYPLSKDACQVMLKMKLLDGTMDEVEPHWTAVKTILKYLRNTEDILLVYGGNLEAELRVDFYYNVGFDTNRDDIKS
ncbi:hypothetical protein Tco_1376222 [Tanacetum coccineum]